MEVYRIPINRLDEPKKNKHASSRLKDMAELEELS